MEGIPLQKEREGKQKKPPPMTATAADRSSLCRCAWQNSRILQNMSFAIVQDNGAEGVHGKGVTRAALCCCVGAILLPKLVRT